jgi:hypothetical protein
LKELSYTGVAEVITEGYIKPTDEDIRKYEQNKEESYKEQVRNNTEILSSSTKSF